MFVPKWVVDRMMAEAEELRRIGASQADEIRSLGERLMAAIQVDGEKNKQIASLETSVDWLRTRVNVLELERSALLSKQLGIEMGAPVISPKDQIDAFLRPKQHIAEEYAVSFDDVGDEEASRLGLGHADDGTLVRR